MRRFPQSNPPKVLRQCIQRYVMDNNIRTLYTRSFWHSTVIQILHHISHADRQTYRAADSLSLQQVNFVCIHQQSMKESSYVLDWYTLTTKMACFVRVTQDIIIAQRAKSQPQRCSKWSKSTRAFWFVCVSVMCATLTWQAVHCSSPHRLRLAVQSTPCSVSLIKSHPPLVVCITIPPPKALQSRVPEQQNIQRWPFVCKLWSRSS